MESLYSTLPQWKKNPKPRLCLEADGGTDFGCQACCCSPTHSRTNTQLLFMLLLTARPVYSARVLWLQTFQYLSSPIETCRCTYTKGIATSLAVTQMQWPLICAGLYRAPMPLSRLRLHFRPMPPISLFADCKAILLCLSQLVCVIVVASDEGGAVDL